MLQSKTIWKVVIPGLLIFLTAALAGCGGTQKQAADKQQVYPTKPIQLIVAFPPGGGADVTARLISEYVAKKWGQSVDVVNVAGGAAVIGTQQAMKAAPDGYTMLLDCHASSSMMAAAQPQLPFDWTKRTVIARVSLDPVFYVVNTSSKAKTLAEVVGLVKENPKDFKWGTVGISGLSTFAVAQLFAAGGIDIKSTNMVTLQGGAPVLTSLAGGHIDLAAQQLSEVTPLLTAGKIRALAVVSDKRIPQFPDVPTVAEAGFAKLNITGWQGISGPDGLPRHVVDKWTSVLQEIEKDPTFQEKANKLGKIPAYMGADETKKMIDNEYQQYLSLAKLVGLQK